jgi:transposase-like protein
MNDEEARLVQTYHCHECGSHSCLRVVKCLACASENIKDVGLTAYSESEFRRIKAIERGD